MKSIRFRITRSGIVLAASLVVLAAAIGIRLAGIQMQTVTSGSMEPAIHPGDIALTQPVPIASLRVGDVIAFYPPGDPKPRIHRIASLVLDTHGATLVTTRGDANSVDDPWGAVQLRGTTAFRYVGVIPFVGWATQLRGWLLIAAGLLLAISLLREFRKERRLRSPGPARF
jgi:signal peptidase I